MVHGENRTHALKTSCLADDTIVEVLLQSTGLPVNGEPTANPN